VEKISIIKYDPVYQPGIDSMMQAIQLEFNEVISSPQSTRIYEVAQLADQRYWIALYGDQVIGTIGLVLYAHNSAVIKRMMVHPDFRGKHYPTAGLLLTKCVEWAREKKVETIYLGTMAQFIAAQKFYEKNGFKEISKNELPSDYISNPIDTLYYQLPLKKD
jgi:N-acetylglutamate synthase-like GNAT family acetyltransferase